MGKKDKNKKKGKGAEKTATKTDKKLIMKQKKLLAKIGEVRLYFLAFFNFFYKTQNNFSLNNIRLTLKKSLHNVKIKKKSFYKQPSQL